MATQGALLLEIVTPNGVKLRERVDEVVARSVKGEFGVLPGHLPMLAALDIGLLHYREGNTVTDVAVGAGFAEIFHDTVIVLTDRFITGAEIERGDHILEVRKRLQEVDEELEQWEGELGDPKRRALIDEERWLAVQLELYGDSPLVVLEESPGTDYSDVLPDLDESADDTETPEEQPHA
jgi:F-type H+-transporting ATPase subunit epsilon